MPAAERLDAGRDLAHPRAIEGIMTVITEISDTATTIASRVEDQGRSTQEIARNLHEAARGTRAAEYLVHPGLTVDRRTGPLQPHHAAY